MDLHTVAIGLYNKDTFLVLSIVPKHLQNVNTIWPGTHPCSLVDEISHTITSFSDIKISRIGQVFIGSELLQNSFVLHV